MSEPAPIIRSRILNGNLFMILLPAFFLLHNYNEVFGFLPVMILVKYAFVIYTATIVLYITGSYYLKSSIRVSLILFLLNLLFLFFGPLLGFIKNLAPGSFLARYSFILPFTFLLMIFLFVSVIRRPFISPSLIHYLNLVMISLFGLELIMLVSNFVSTKRDRNLIYSSKTLSQQFIVSNQADSSKPDVFLLVFDEYTSNSELKATWNFDNQPISHWLQNRDFYLPSSSAANYPCTFFSLPSMFNMNYLDSKKSSDATIIKNILQGTQSLSDNETMRIFQKEGYSIRFLAPYPNSFEENGLGNYFDFLIVDKLRSQTLPGRVQKDLWWNFQSAKSISEDESSLYQHLHKKVSLAEKTMSMMKASCDSNSHRKPQWVYTHFMIPHEPNVFDSTGGFKPELKDFSNAAIFKTYIEQVKYANKIIMELVSFIRAYNKPNTIIIVMGDHGFKEYEGSWSKPDEYPNFAAFYFPNHDYRHLYDYISPVNYFRIIFNQFFAQQLPLLKDSLVRVKLQ